MSDPTQVLRELVEKWRSVNFDRQIVKCDSVEADELEAAMPQVEAEIAALKRKMTPEDRAHELGLLHESDGMLNQREVFLLEEINRLESSLADLKRQLAGRSHLTVIPTAKEFARRCDPFDPDREITTGTCAAWRYSVEKAFEMVNLALDAYVAKKVAEARRDEAEHLQKQLWIIRTKFAAGKRQKARRRMDLIEKELLLPRLTELRAAADTPAQPARTEK